jgi:hypothetical protein
MDLKALVRRGTDIHLGDSVICPNTALVCIKTRSLHKIMHLLRRGSKDINEVSRRLYANMHKRYSTI